MDTMECIMRAQLARMESQKLKVFDWNKAAAIIKEKRSTLAYASAGLQKDCGNTTGIIFEDGNVVTDDYCYLASIWDTPVLTLDFTDEESEEIECWRYKDEVPEWDSGTKWPESALVILND